MDTTISLTAYDWLDAAACRFDPSLKRELTGFKGAQVPPAAKLTCRMCPVRVQCLASAFETGSDYGYFGGVSPAERRRAGSAEEVVRRLIDAGELAPSAMDRLPSATPIDAVLAVA